MLPTRLSEDLDLGLLEFLQTDPSETDLHYFCSNIARILYPFLPILSTEVERLLTVNL